jgi:predicted RNase H-like nuclease (RuvC/YqgF family)
MAEDNPGPSNVEGADDPQKTDEVVPKSDYEALNADLQKLKGSLTGKLTKAQERIQQLESELTKLGGAEWAERFNEMDTESRAREISELLSKERTLKEGLEQLKQGQEALRQAHLELTKKQIAQQYGIDEALLEGLSDEKDMKIKALENQPKKSTAKGEQDAGGRGGGPQEMSPRDRIAAGLKELKR